MNIYVCKLCCWQTDRWRCWGFISTTDAWFLFFVPHILLRSKWNLSRVLVVRACECDVELFNIFSCATTSRHLWTCSKKKRKKKKKKKSQQFVEYFPAIDAEGKQAFHCTSYWVPRQQPVSCWVLHACRDLHAPLGGPADHCIATYTPFFCTSRAIDVSNVLPPVRGAENTSYKQLLTRKCQKHSNDRCMHFSAGVILPRGACTPLIKQLSDRCVKRSVSTLRCTTHQPETV